MPGLVPGIPIPGAESYLRNRDGRDKPGHDVEREPKQNAYSAAASPFCAFRRRHSMAKSVDMMSPKVR